MTGSLDLGLEGIAELVPEGTATARWRGRSGRPPDASTRWLSQVQLAAAREDRPPEHVHLAWEIARLAPAAVQPAVHLLALLALGDLGTGSTRTPRDERLPTRLRALAPGDDGARAVELALALLVDPEPAAPALARAGAPLLVSERALQLERAQWLEEHLAAALAARAASETAPGETPSSPPPSGASGPRLSPEQEAAVEAALGRRLAVITGGPGTGKSTIVVALLRALRARGIALSEVALAAPTGKATHRLAAAVRDELPDVRTETLHRLLGARPGEARFAHGLENPLPLRAVIVDEGSMLDLELAKRLVDALAPDTRLVLLGDADQLPSVDAGAVLGELVESLPAGAVARLTKSFRMDDADPAGRAVLELARALRAGDGARVRGLSEAGSGPVRFVSVRSEAERAAFLAEELRRSPLGDPAHRARVRKIRSYQGGRFEEEDAREVSAALETARRRQLLTVTRRPGFVHGAEATSAAIHALHAQQSGLREQDEFLPGEPVMMLRNDYERRLFNGDVGLVLLVARDREAARPTAVFAGRDGPEAFDLGPLGQDLVLAHAMTVHKAQGSEYEEVSLLLPEVDVPLLTREILYTAATRAKKSVLLAGRPEILELGLKRRVARASGLGERLLELAAEAERAAASGPASGGGSAST